MFEDARFTNGHFLVTMPLRGLGLISHGLCVWPPLPTPPGAPVLTATIGTPLNETLPLRCLDNQMKLHYDDKVK